MRYKKYRIFLLLIMLLIIITSIAAISINYSLSETNIDMENKNKPLYYLKEYKEQIGIFNADEKKPFEIIDVYVYTLPFLDQQNLKSGIPIYDYAQLKKAKEDFES